MHQVLAVTGWSGPPRRRNVGGLYSREHPAFATEMRRDRLAMAAMVDRAPADPVAARHLEAELSRRIESMQQALADLQASEPSDSMFLTDLRKDLAQAEAQLQWCRALPKVRPPAPGASHLTRA
jgi:hypothetical protein